MVTKAPTPDASAVLAAALTALPRALSTPVVASAEPVLGGTGAAPTARSERSAAKGDPRVRVVSPTDGQVFAPGDTVNATVQLAAPLTAWAGYLGVGAPGLGVLTGTDYNGSSYRVHFTIPVGYAGALELTPDIVDPSGTAIEGVGVTIVVHPTTAAMSLRPVEADFYFRSIGQKGKIYVSGNYPGGRTLNLTSSASGTVYESSDPHVIAVDAEGRVEAIGFGTASVRSTNQGAKTFFTFAVEDVAHPLAPQDLTARVRFEKSPLIPSTNVVGSLTQTVTVVNISGWPIVGPLYLSVRGLTKDGWLLGMPPGEPIYFLDLEPQDGVTLGPSERATRSLDFVGTRPNAEFPYELGLVRCTCDPGRHPR